MKHLFYIFLLINLFFCSHNNAYLYAHEPNIALIKKYNIHYKKIKAAVVKVIRLLKKRERSYKALCLNLQKMHKALFKK